MKPGSKLQVRVVQLSEQLGKLEYKHYNWAKENLLHYAGTILKSGKCSCLKCGHQWQQDGQNWEAIVGTDNCPSCGTKIKLKQTRTKNFEELVYFHVVTTVEEFQVIRLARMLVFYSAGKKVRTNHYEVSQIWMCSKTGKYEIIGRNRKGAYGYYGDQWDGEFTLRHRNHLESHCLASDGVYPEIKVLQKYKRNGFKSSFHGANPYMFLTKLEHDSRFETLLKAKQFRLVRSMCGSYNRVHNFWPTIKICIRNNYKVKNVSDYFDYLEMLIRFKKDIRSPKYVCPTNLHQEHQRYVKKKNAIDERNSRIREAKKAEERLRKIEEDRKKYDERTTRYQGFEFSKAKLRIKFMDTVDEVSAAGTFLNHRIFQNGYYNKKNSLLFACYFDGVLVETAEFSISEMEVIQCRGHDNKSSEYNKRILDLFKEYTPHIAKLINKKMKAAA